MIQGVVRKLKPLARKNASVLVRSCDVTPSCPQDKVQIRVTAPPLQGRRIQLLVIFIFPGVFLRCVLSFLLKSL